MTSKKQNCWEYMKCGREPGGEKVAELGICRAANEEFFNGIKDGKNGGRICFAFAGTYCAGGFADVEMSFDGKTLTLLGKNPNLYTQLEVPGTIDHLVDELKDTYNRPLPAADLLLSNSYDDLMHGVINIKDLGSGVIGGVECDFLAFRTKDVDWQIWIAQGDRPYPCRYVITSKLLSSGPQYTIQIRDWKTGGDVAATDFRFKNPTKANKVELKDLKGSDALPDHFMKGDAK